MIGVNIDNLETLRKKNDLYLDSFNNNIKKLISIKNELNSCYSGISLDYLFLEPMSQTENIKTISNLIESYSNVLINVKNGYLAQDVNLKIQTDHINSEL